MLHPVGSMVPMILDGMVKFTFKRIIMAVLGIIKGGLASVDKNRQNN